MSWMMLWEDWEDWKDQAKCQGKTYNETTDYWYPDPEEPEEIRKRKTHIAKTFCKACPVKIQCLEYALRRDEQYGIWGAKTPRERSVIKRKRENP